MSVVAVPITRHGLLDADISTLQSLYAAARELHAGLDPTQQADLMGRAAAGVHARALVL